MVRRFSCKIHFSSLSKTGSNHLDDEMKQVLVDLCRMLTKASRPDFQVRRWSNLGLKILIVSKRFK